MICDIGEFYGLLSSHFTFHLDETCLTMTLHEDLYYFLRVSRYAFIGERKRNISNKMSSPQVLTVFGQIYESIFELSYSTMNRCLLKIIAVKKAKTKEILC